MKMWVFENILNHKSLNSSEKVLFLRLFLIYGDQPFFGTFEKIAETLKMNQMTVKLNMTKLKKKGFIIYGKVYSEGRGLCGVNYQLVNRGKRKS
jgi:predicted ArsR family transcriptional regulator